MFPLRDRAAAIRNAFGDIRLFPKYLLSHGIIAVLTAMAVSFISFHVAKSEIEINARTSARAIMEQAGLLLEKNGSDLQKNLVAQLEQADIYRTLREAGTVLDSASILNLEHKIAVLMSTNRWMRAVYYESTRGQRAFVAADGSDIGPAAIRRFNPSAIAYLHGRAYWYVDDDGSVYFCKKLYDLETTEDLGMIAICVDPGFFDMLSSSIGESRGLGSFFVISKDSNQLIFHTKASAAALRQVLSWASQRRTPPERMRDGVDTYLIISLLTGSQNWEIVNIITMEELTALSTRTGGIILLTTLGSLALSILLALVLVRSEVGKITTLVAQTRRISGGDFSVEPCFRSADELGELAVSISSMASEIGDLVSKVAAERSQKMEVELRALKFEYSALQSRINPHFVSNTLELINSLAKLEKVPKIGEVACLLGDLMRDSIRRKEDLLSLEEELDHCRTYLHIQELLLESRLDVAYDIGPSLMACRVPNLILQPIVENAVIHGIEPKLGKSRLIVSARREAGKLFLAVTDDGVGIEPGRLPELLDPNRSGNGAKIGLESVDKRIKILFGPDYGLSIESWPGKGTVVTLAMPAIGGAP